MILKVNHILQMPGQTFREYRTSSLLLYPNYPHLVRRPAPRSRPENHATPEHRKGCPPALSCRLPNSKQVAQPKPPFNPCFLPLPTPCNDSKAHNAVVHSAASLPAFRTVTLRSTTLHAYRSALSRKTAISAQRT